MKYYKDYILPLFVKSILLFCRALNVIKDNITTIYESNAIIKKNADSIYYKIFELYAYSINQKIEPLEIPWISVSWMNSYSFLYKYKEKYFFDDCETTFSDYTTTSYLDQQELPLIIYKKDISDSQFGYIVRKNGSNNPEFSKSSVMLYSVEYTHPDLTNGIEIRMGPEWFFTGNELFTPTFVLRMLEYQSKHFVFDNKYILKIMDGNCNIISFGSESFMYINADDYDLCSNTIKK